MKSSKALILLGASPPHPAPPQSRSRRAQAQNWVKLEEDSTTSHLGFAIGFLHVVSNRGSMGDKSAVRVFPSDSLPHACVSESVEETTCAARVPSSPVETKDANRAAAPVKTLETKDEKRAAAALKTAHGHANALEPKEDPGGD